MKEVNYEIIEQYLHGELSGQQLQEFEQELRTNAALAAEVELYKNIENNLQRSQQYKEEEHALAGTLKDLGSRHFSATAKTTPVRKLWWAAAAVAAVLLAFLIIKPLWKTTAGNQDLYAQYAIPEELPVSDRGSNTDTAMASAAQLYNQQEYAKALPLLNGIIERRPGQYRWQLALGICQLQTGDHSNSIATFNELSSGSHIYKYEALFWKALTLLKQNKKEDCSVALQEIPADAPAYAKAQELLKKLSK